MTGVQTCALPIFSHDRRKIHWQSVGILGALNLVIAWILTSFPWGRAAVQGAAAGFNKLVSVAWKGINFALANWVGAEGVDPAPVNFVVGALLPILLVVPLFDILTYIGLLPWVIKWIGRGLSVVTRQPRFEAFYSIEMMSGRSAWSAPRPRCAPSCPGIEDRKSVV